MREIKEAIEIVENLESKYDLAVDGIKAIEEHFEDFKVYVPLIGRFSAGKSALINTLLNMGIDICPENIGVETALPTEVFYGRDDKVWVCRPQKEELSIDEFERIRDKLNAYNADVVKMAIDNDVLAGFPNVALVDMPGLDSGYDIHDKAIDRYIKNSMAFILVFPADELTIPQSMEPILHDLNTYQVPMCVVITKGGRIAGMEQQRISELKQSLTRYFGNQQIPVFVSEKETGEVGELYEFLVELENQANFLGKNYYKKRLEPELAQISNYLTGYLKNMELSMSELEEQRDQLQKDMDELDKTVSKELDEFTAKIPEIVDSVAGDVQAALSGQMEEFVYDLTHDTDITSSVSETVRNTLNRSYQQRVVGSMKKHLEKISNAISMGSANYASSMKIDIDKVCGKEINGVGKTAITVLGLIFGGPLGGIIAHLFTNMFNQNNQEKRKAAEQKIRQQLSADVFPAVDREVRDKVETDLRRIALEMRQTVEKDVNIQMESLKKSFEEIIARKQIEDEAKEQKQLEIQNDMKLLGEVTYALE